MSYNTPEERALNAYESGFVQRYHTHPRFARFGQTDGHHAWGVAALIVALHPEPSALLLRAAITHDQGERFAGDLPMPVKRKHTELAQDHAFIEQDILARRFTNAEVLVWEDDARWLKMCDMLECVLFASLTLPAALCSRNWRELVRDILTAADGLTVQPVANVENLINLARENIGFKEDY